jgi:hypothetical protein
VTTRFAPDTWIQTARINSRKGGATFLVAAGAPTSGFQCALKSKKRPTPRFKRCERFVTYSHLKRGRYEFEVRALFAHGPDPTPAKWRFRIR